MHCLPYQSRVQDKRKKGEVHYWLLSSIVHNILYILEMLSYRIPDHVSSEVRDQWPLSQHQIRWAQFHRFSSPQLLSCKIASIDLANGEWKRLEC